MKIKITSHKSAKRVRNALKRKANRFGMSKNQFRKARAKFGPKIW